MTFKFGNDIAVGTTNIKMQSEMATFFQGLPFEKAIILGSTHQMKMLESEMRFVFKAYTFSIQGVYETYSRRIRNVFEANTK